VAGNGAAQRARAAGAGRADGGPRPGAAHGAVGGLPAAGAGRHHAAGVQPCDGRGRPLRRDRADARRADPGVRSEGAAARPHRGGGRGVGVPAAGGLLSGRIVLATAMRVLRQLRRDPRTLALLIVVPCVLEALIKWVFEGDEQIFQRVGVPLVGIFPLVSMFLVTSIAMLRERTTGTLERLMTMPLAKLDLLLGYGLAFAVMATVQAVTVSVVAIGLLGLDVAGSTVLVVVFAVLNALLGMSMGLFLSAFASTEFQAVQFMPAFLLPQLLLCGLLTPRDQMARPLELISYVLPMTYAYDALSRVASSSEVTSEVWRDAVILVGATVLALCGGAATLHRRTG